MIYESILYMSCHYSSNACFHRSSFIKKNILSKSVRLKASNVAGKVCVQLMSGRSNCDSKEPEEQNTCHLRVDDAQTHTGDN